MRLTKHIVIFNHSATIIEVEDEQYDEETAIGFENRLIEMMNRVLNEVKYHECAPKEDE